MKASQRVWKHKSLFKSLYKLFSTYFTDTFPDVRFPAQLNSNFITIFGKVPYIQT